MSDFDFELPPELIAQVPAKKRQDSRLMVIQRSVGAIEHHYFRDLPDLLGRDDLLVLNNTRVFPARLFGRKQGGSARVEVLLLRDLSDCCWEALVRPGRRVQGGSRIVFEDSVLEADVLEGSDSYKRRLRFDFEGDFWSVIGQIGCTPLPPYIRRRASENRLEDKRRYQTVYAKREGSVAAPTAGLHFTHSMLRRLNYCELTLHVGYGTFKPVSTARITEHKVDAEYYSISAETASKIELYRSPPCRVLAVGTTSTRTLEHLGRKSGPIVAAEGWTDLFIYPGHKFRVIDGLLTNFHLPRSSLFLLVSAFGGMELVRAAYREAVERRYRFYSYGDAMLIV